MREGINYAGLARHARFIECMRWLISRRKTVEEQPEIAVGSLWTLNTGDPFPSKYEPSRVLDVKDGWVRYYLGSVFPDERRTVESFLQIYKPYKEEL